MQPTLPTDQFVTLRGARFHYLDWGGDGPPMLLLAGLGCSAHVFAELAPHLTESFRVVGLTRRGHGPSDQVPGSQAIEETAEDARLFLDAMDIDRAHVGGHSMGGGEASALAARHPDRVASVVYLDGAYDWAESPRRGAGADGGAMPEHFASFDAYVDFVRSELPGFDLIWGPALEAMLRSGVNTHEDGSVSDKLPDAAFLPFVEALNGFRHPYADIEAPALAIYATGAQWLGDAAAWHPAWQARCRERFIAEVRNGRALAFDGATHYLFIDRRDDVLAVMHEFHGDDIQRG
jgi:pimeloyl-ACP methyl ester carboxylesterase